MDQRCTAVAMDDAGNVVLAGTTPAVLISAPEPCLRRQPGSTTNHVGCTVEWRDWRPFLGQVIRYNRQCDPHAVAFDGQGNAIVAGTFASPVVFGSTLTPLGSADAFVVRLDTTLNPLWARRWGGVSGTSESNGAVVDSTGKVTVVGAFNRSIDVGPSGALLQVSNPSGAQEPFIVTLDVTTGQSLCARHYGDSSSLGSTALAIGINRHGGANKDRAAIVGAFSKAIDFGAPTTPLASSGWDGRVLA